MKEDKIPELINKNKLLEIMSKEQMRMGLKNSPSDEWFGGWVNCSIVWQDIIKELPDETKKIQEQLFKAFCEIPVTKISKTDELVSTTLKETIENLNSVKASLELRPLFSKPKTEIRTLEDVIDEVLYCKNCGAYACYPTEHNARDEYIYCHHCGKLLDWDDVSMSEDYKKLEEVENERSCNKDI